jgi:hypothetical protein
MIQPSISRASLAGRTVPAPLGVRQDAGGENSAPFSVTSDYSRVRMKIMTHSDTIAVTLQKTCKPRSLREDKLSVAPIPTPRERWFA